MRSEPNVGIRASCEVRVEWRMDAAVANHYNCSESLTHISYGNWVHILKRLNISKTTIFFGFILFKFPPKISNFSEELKKGKPLIPKQLNINNFQCLWWKNPEELIQVRRNSWKFYQKSTILCSSQLKFSKPRQNISMMHKSKRKGAEGRGIGGRKIYIHNKFPWVLCSTWWLVSEERKRRNVMAQYKWQYMRKVPKKVCSHEHESWNMKQKITESTPWHLSPCLTSPKSSSPQKSQNVGDL